MSFRTTTGAALACRKWRVMSETPEEVVEAAVNQAQSVYPWMRGPEYRMYGVAHEMFTAALSVTDSDGVPVLLKPWLVQVGWGRPTKPHADLRNFFPFKVRSWRSRPDPDPTEWEPVYRVLREDR